MTDSYIYVIVALLPLTSLLLVFQANPYQALVTRAILGEVAALVYAIFGAVDVALTEALLGTMLAVTLYAIAIRSSLVMRLGIVATAEAEKESYFKELIANLRKVVKKHHLRLELVKYPNSEALEQALMAKEVHATCTKAEQLESDSDVETTITDPQSGSHFWGGRIAIRVPRLFEIMQTELTYPETTLTYVTVSNREDKQHK